MLSFLGAGAYDHHFPPAVDQLLLRSEFYTAYTPYQPEVAQGTLQAIFEFQTIVSEIFGLPVANASMYDGASAAAEAVLMARRLTGASRCSSRAGVHPHYLETIDTYVPGIGTGKTAIARCRSARTARADLERARRARHHDEHRVRGDRLPELLRLRRAMCARAAEIAHAKGALLITVTTRALRAGAARAARRARRRHRRRRGAGARHPAAVRRAQASGSSLAATGASTCSRSRAASCGETVDKNGRARLRAHARDARAAHPPRARDQQHLHEHAGSARSAVTIRMCMLGKRGLHRGGAAVPAKAEYLKSEIGKLPGYRSPTRAPTFNEFAVRVRGGDASALVERS